MSEDSDNFQQRRRVLIPEESKAALSNQHQNIDEPSLHIPGILHCSLHPLETASTLSKQSMQQHSQSHQPHHTTNLPLQPLSTTLLTDNIAQTSIPMIRIDTAAPSICSRLIVDMTPSRIARSLVVSTREARVVVIRYDISAIAAHVHNGCIVAAGPQSAETGVGDVGWIFQKVGTF